MSVERPQARQDGLAGERIVTLEHPCDEAAAHRALARDRLEVIRRAGAIDDDELLEVGAEPLGERVAVDGASGGHLALEDQAQAGAVLWVASAETSASMSDEPAAPATDMVRST